MKLVYKNLRGQQDSLVSPDGPDHLLTGESGVNKLSGKESLVRETRSDVREALAPPDLQALRTKTLEYLQKGGYLKFSNKHKKWLVDTDRIKQLDFRQLDESGILAGGREKRSLVKLAKSISPQDQTRYCAIFAILADLQASPMSDPDSDVKPLIFRPTQENVYELDTYKQPDGLLSITDMNDSNRGLQINHFRYPGLSAEDAKLSWILYYIYHPDHGAGERNEAGELMVNYRDKEGRVVKRAPISNNWINSEPLQKLEFEGDELRNMTSVTLEKHGKALEKSNGLRSDDFRRTKSTAEASHISRAITTNKGEIGFNGAIYYLGVSFTGGNVTFLDENLSAIRDKKGEWYIFEPLTDEEVRSIEAKTSHKNPRFYWNSDEFNMAERLHRINPASLPATANDSDIIQHIDELIRNPKNRNQKIQRLFDASYLPPDTTKMSSAEKISGFADFLKKHKARRLRLESPEERIPENEAESRRDDEDGFMCVYDDEKRYYRKISTDFIKQNFAEFSTDNLKQLYDNPDIDFRPSDIGILDFVPRKLGKKNSTSVINGVRYYFPTNEFKIKTTGERITINPAIDRFLKLSEKYAVLILNRPSGTRAYQLQLSSKEELSDDPTHQERLSRYKMTYLSSGTTAEQLGEWDVTPLVSPHANEQPQDYARRVMRCSDINRFLGIYRELVDGAQFNLQAYDLKKQLLFASYYANLTPEAKQDVQHLLREQGEAFFNTFQACEFGLGMGDLVVEIAKKHGKAAMPIFSQFEELMKVADQKEQIQESEAFDETRFYTVVVKRGAELLKAVAGKKAGEDLNEFVKKARQYHADVVTFGAQMAAIATTTKTVPTSPEAINEALSDIHVDELEAGEMIKKGSRLAMQSRKNYLQPDRFNERDYKMIVENLEQAYGDIDPGWLQHLIDNIPNDLNNPKVTFLLVKNKKGELVGVIKRKKEGDGKYYFGTMYVEKEYQKGFGIGQYLDSYMKQGLPEDAVMEGTVAAANPAAARHIDAVGYVGNRITTEGAGKKKSQALINLDLNPRYPFETKNRKAFSEDKLKKLHAEGKVPEGLRILVRDTSSDNVDEYTRELDGLFKQGYFLTRFFYEDGRNQKRTYLVLEKPHSGQAAIGTGETIKEAA